MMNCSFSNYLLELRLLELMEHRVRTAYSTANYLRGDIMDAPTDTWLRLVDEVRLQVKSAEELFAPLESHVLKEHVQSIRWALDYGGQRSQTEIADKLSTIRATIEIELRKHQFYHYPPEKVRALAELQADWGEVVSVFPDAEPEIVAGVDCYASGFDTACVFHMMRAAEIGLRRVAAENQVKLSKKKPLTHAQWGEILGALERRVKQVEGRKAGPAKDVALSYYARAHSHLRALKDQYRNNVMHAKRSFDAFEARDAIFHTRSFMTGLVEGVVKRGSAKS